MCRSLDFAWQLHVHILVLFIVTFLGDQELEHGNLCFHLTDKETGLRGVGKRHPLCLTTPNGQIPYFPILPHAVQSLQREPFSDLNCQVQLTRVAEPELEPPGTGVTSLDRGES